MPPFLSKQDMADLVVTAWEGGSTYWIESAEYIPPEGMTLKELRKAAWEAASDAEKELWLQEGPGGRWPLYAFLPFLPPSVKWKIKLTPASEGPEPEEAVYLTPDNMRQAAPNLVKNKYAQVFGRIKDENYDAADADAWLQMAVFGDVIYG